MLSGHCKHLLVVVYKLLSRIYSEFRDVVFEDVVFDNDSYISYSYMLPCMGSHNCYYQTHPQTPHP